MTTIEAIKARCEAATPGPWAADGYGDMIWAENPYGRGRMMLLNIRGWGHLTGKGCCRFTDERAAEIQNASAAFIAHAREDIPYLLERVAELEGQLSASQQETRAAVEDLHKMHSLCMDIGGCCPECGDQIDTLMDGACDFCKKSGVNCWVETPGDESKCAAFEWHGPQEAGEESG